MKLNEEGKEKMRDYLEQIILANCEEFKSKILLESKSLEELIFKQETINDRIVKFPIWTGPFLKYIDLSGISCDDVCWNLAACESILHSQYLFDRFSKKSNEYAIDFGGTNIVIDFKKSVFFPEKAKINRCNFEKVNLANNNLDAKDFESESIINCNFKNTHINITFQPTLQYDMPRFVERIKAHEFDGCYINQVLMVSTDIQQEAKDGMSQRYQCYIDERIKEIDDAIQKAKK